MRYIFFILFIFFLSCSKVDNRIIYAKEGDNNTSSTQKKEPILIHNTEPEEFTIIEMETPTVYIKTDDNIEILIELADNESISSFITESENYIIFYIREHSINNENLTSLIFRKSDSRLFRFNANGGHGNMLYYINYDTWTFEFFEITDDGAKKDITSVPIPNGDKNWHVVKNGFLFSREDIYILNDTTLTMYAYFPLSVGIIGSFHLFAYYPRHRNNNIMKLINISNMKETNIENGNLISITKESIFFTDGNRMAHYDIFTDTFSFLVDIINTNDKNIGYYLSSYFIKGFEEYPLDMLCNIHNNQLIFLSMNKICMYDFDTGSLYILFDYNIYPHIKNYNRLSFINNNYFFGETYGASDFISLDERKIIYRFVMNWITTAKTIKNISKMDYYETREGDIIIYPVFEINSKE